jgi:hypothetical protein
VGEPDNPGAHWSDGKGDEHAEKADERSWKLAAADYSHGMVMMRVF